MTPGDPPACGKSPPSRISDSATCTFSSAFSVAERVSSSVIAESAKNAVVNGLFVMNSTVILPVIFGTPFHGFDFLPPPQK